MTTNSTNEKKVNEVIDTNKKKNPIIDAYYNSGASNKEGFMEFALNYVGYFDKDANRNEDDLASKGRSR